MDEEHQFLQGLIMSRRHSPQTNGNVKARSAFAARGEGRAGRGCTLRPGIPRAPYSQQYLTGDRPTKDARHADQTPASARPASAPEVASASARARGSVQCASTGSRGLWPLPRCPRYVGVALARAPRCLFGKHGEAEA